MWVGRRRPESAPPPCSQTATHWPSIAASERGSTASASASHRSPSRPKKRASSSSTSSWKHQRTDAPTSSGSSSPFFFFFSFPFFLRPSSACAAASSCSCWTTRVACSMHDGCIPSSWPSSVARIGGGVSIPHATRSSASQRISIIRGITRAPPPDSGPPPTPYWSAPAACQPTSVGKARARQRKCE